MDATVIDPVVSEVDHTLSDPYDEVKTTEPPEQNVVGPPAVIVGTAGGVGSVKVCVNVFDVQPLSKVML